MLKWYLRARFAVWFWWIRKVVYWRMLRGVFRGRLHRDRAEKYYWQELHRLLEEHRP